MSKQLYEEALAEVKQLKQIAEDNAKKAIMDEVTPRIKQLIESQLMNVSAEGDIVEDVDCYEEDRLEPAQKPGSQILGDRDDNQADSVDSNNEEVIELSQTAEGVLRQLMKSKPTRLKEFRTLVYKLGQSALNLDGKLNESTDISTVDLLEAIKGTYVLLRETVIESPARMALEDTLDSYYKLVLKHQELGEMKQNRKGKSVRESALNIKIDGFDEESLSDDVLDSLEIEIAPEAEEEEAEDFGADDSEASGEEAGEETEEVSDLDSEESEEDEEKMEGSIMDGFARLSDDTVVEIDEGMLRREIARMKFLREERSAAPVEKKSPRGKKMTPGVLSAFGGGKSEGDPWLDGDVTTEGLEEEGMNPETSNPVDELEELALELADDSAEETAKTDEAYMDEVESADSAEDESLAGGAGMDEADDAEAEDDMDETEKRDADTRSAHPAMQPNVQSHDVAESRRRLAKVLEARKLAAGKAQQAKKLMERAQKAGNKVVFAKAKKVYTEATRAYAQNTKVAKALNESLNKQNSNSSAAAQTAALRKQLAETNLFNAKLLYTNKLLQNDTLTSRQKVTIIEKLDEARSLREAKLVYESLTRTISSGKDRVNESADRQVLGSASRATRPGSTVSLNEGVETARWAKLAGITK